MRELARNIARENMRNAGIRRINKKRITGKKKGKRRSFFAANWREWVKPRPGQVARTTRRERIQSKKGA
jgi:hypothetical protein